MVTGGIRSTVARGIRLAVNLTLEDRRYRATSPDTTNWGLERIWERRYSGPPFRHRETGEIAAFAMARRIFASTNPEAIFMERGAAFLAAALGNQNLTPEEIGKVAARFEAREGVEVLQEIEVVKLGNRTELRRTSLGVIVDGCEDFELKATFIRGKGYRMEALLPFILMMVDAPGESLSQVGTAATEFSLELMRVENALREALREGKWVKEKAADLDLIISLLLEGKVVVSNLLAERLAS